MKKNDLIKALGEEKKWMVMDGTHGSIRLVRQFNHKPMVVELHRSDGDVRGWEVRFPQYVFNSSVSFFAPAHEELRFSRNKALLRMVICCLKQSEVWSHITNKKFVVTNQYNRKLTNSRKSKELESLYGWKPRKRKKD